MSQEEGFRKACGLTRLDAWGLLLGAFTLFVVLPYWGSVGTQALAQQDLERSMHLSAIPILADHQQRLEERVERIIRQVCGVRALACQSALRGM